MKMKFIFGFLVLFTSMPQLYAQYITVDDTYTAEDLVNDVLFSNSCASVSNVSVSGGNFGNGQESWGFFSGNGSNFPFQNGIILSSGKIDNAPGPNTYISDDGGGNINWGGDSDLNQALGISNSLNATVLEFDFIPIGSHISFNYIFSSEEYHGTATCTYSDGFAFLLREAGSTAYQNLAVIPGTNTPVKVTNVHPDIPGGCNAQNEQYFDAFNGTNHPTNYNGQTKRMIAEADVTPGVQYHIKLVIADEGNYRYDSAIFLEGGSFNFGLDLGNDRTVANGNPICSSENPYTIGQTIPGATYQWFQNNSPLTGETNATLDVTSDGIYKVEVSIGGCIIDSEVELEFAPNLTVNQTDFESCDADDNQDGITAFDLNNIATQLFSNLPSNFQISFYELGSNTALPSDYTNTTAYQQTILARISNINCYSDYPINLTVHTFEETINDVTLGLCNGNIETLQADSGFSSYLWDDGSTTESINVNSAGNYSVTITNDQGCSKIKTFFVITSEAATITDIVIHDFDSNNTATILTSGNGNYEYSLNGINYQDSPVFEYLEEGEYTIYIQDKNGCGITIGTFYILNYPKYFTPNGDNYNDYWNIKNLDKRGLQASKIFIFDRFGKLLKQISPEGTGWNGTYNDQPLPSSDYWFVLELTNGKTIKGHFALKR